MVQQLAVDVTMGDWERVYGSHAHDALFSWRTRDEIGVGEGVAVGTAQARLQAVGTAQGQVTAQPCLTTHTAIDY